MPKVNINDVKNGQALDISGQLMLILTNQFVKPGKGSAFVRTKLKNLRTGAVIEKTFNSDIKVEQVFMTKQKMEYIYDDASGLVFMDNDTFDEVSITKEAIGSDLDWLIIGTEVSVMSVDGEILNIELPKKVTLEVIETEPGIKGNTVAGGSKTAKLETGRVINVPLFIKVGDKVSVNTSTAEYDSRQS